LVHVITPEPSTAKQKPTIYVLLANQKTNQTKRKTRINFIHNHFFFITMKSLIGFGIAFLLIHSSLASDANPPYPKAFSVNIPFI
jgi:hypothetical protein